MVKRLVIDICYCGVYFQVINPEYDEAEPCSGMHATIVWESLCLESDLLRTDLTCFMDDDTMEFFVGKVRDHFEN